MNTFTAQVTSLATSTVVAVTSFPNDLLVICGLLLFFCLYAFFLGKGKTLNLICSLYIASFLFSFFPMVDLINRFPISLSLASTLIFAVLFIVTLFAMRRAFRVEYAFGKFSTMVEVILLGTSTTLLALALSQNILPIAHIYSFSPAIGLFMTKYYIFFGALFTPILIVSLLPMRRTYD